jgi:hypothetical protein
MTKDDYGAFFHAKFPGGQQPCVARDGIVVGANQNRVCPAIPH